MGGFGVGKNKLLTFASKAHGFKRFDTHLLLKFYPAKTKAQTENGSLAEEALLCSYLYDVDAKHPRSKNFIRVHFLFELLKQFYFASKPRYDACFDL